MSDLKFSKMIDESTGQVLRYVTVYQGLYIYLILRNEQVFKNGYSAWDGMKWYKHWAAYCYDKNGKRIELSANESTRKEALKMAIKYLNDDYFAPCFTNTTFKKDIE